MPKTIPDWTIIVTVDVVLFALHDKRLHVVLSRRPIEPFAGQWALPGGYVHKQEDADSLAAALREGFPDAEIEIQDTQKKLGDLHVHIGKVVKCTVKNGDAVEMKVDHGRRSGLRAHHSATHLLHEALRRRLGNHVTQKGSLVAPDRLRFDFSHTKGMSPEDVAWVEHEVNRRIRANADVATKLMTPDDAIAAGAMALFGEKYGEEVRVVSMGGKAEEEVKEFSTELCGGTHVHRTGDIGFLKIVSEGAVGAGLRRIRLPCWP